MTAAHNHPCPWCNSPDLQLALEQAQAELRVTKAALAYAEAMLAFMKEEQAEKKGCDHCLHPLWAGIKCGVCGRWAEEVNEGEKE